MTQTRDLEAQLKQLFSDILGVPSNAIEPGSSPETIESWDSLQHVILVAAMEEEFNVDIEPEAAVQIRTFDEALRHLRLLLD